MKKIAVIGAGAWGSALASILVAKQHQVYLWTHSIGFIPDTLAYVSPFLEDVIRESQVVIIAVASKFYRSTVERINSLLTEQEGILSLTKGLEEGSAKRMSTILEETLAKDYHDKYAVLSGPNLALEIREQNPAAGVIASNNLKTAQLFQELLSGPNFRLYTSLDLIGVELGGTLKNIFAIASGISDGFSFGNNARAALMVRGISEMARLGQSLGAQKSTFYGLSGLGDLITTCTSPLSRNYKVGLALAQGKTIEEIESGLTEVAEGINTAKLAYKLAKQLAIETPIIAQMHDVLTAGKSPYEAVRELMSRELKAEEAC